MSDLVSVGLVKEKSLNTRFGNLSVLKREIYGEILSFCGSPIENIEERFVTIIAHSRFTSDCDLLLVECNSGGSLLPARYKFVVLSADEVFATDLFGSGSDIVLDYRVGVGFAEVDFPPFKRPDVALYTVCFDGKNVRKYEAKKTEFGAVPAGPNIDVVRWEGAHPCSILDDASERLRFLRVMSRDDLFELDRTITVASACWIEQGYLFGKGIAPHQGGALHGGLAIRVSDGEPYAAIWRKEGGSQFFGMTAPPPPSQILDFTVTGEFK